MGYLVEARQNDGTFLPKEMCLRTAVSALQYRDGYGRAWFRLPEGAPKTLEELEAELAELPPGEDCKGCAEKKAQEQQKAHKKRGKKQYQQKAGVFNGYDEDLIKEQ